MNTSATPVATADETARCAITADKLSPEAVATIRDGCAAGLGRALEAALRSHLRPGGLLAPAENRPVRGTA